MSFKSDKKAVSPLIATVLLIAFAVSLGAVLLTYMTSLGECGGVSIEIPKLNNKPQICYNSNTNKLDFSVENSGREDIDSLKLTLTGVLHGGSIPDNDPGAFSKYFGRHGEVADVMPNTVAIKPSVVRDSM
ncbi:hypothetical protein HZA99_06885, partial [Candidatus Woesearchaeota archaeon]|nr:hypothetical protein [Candidatus Woesearchaeota archaeon]